MSWLSVHYPPAASPTTSRLSKQRQAQVVQIPLSLSTPQFNTILQHITNCHLLYLIHRLQKSSLTLLQPVSVLQDISTIQVTSSNQR